METVRFDQLDLYPQVLRAIAEMGFEEATPIQSQAIPVVMSGVDVIGQAQTGTGKTASFGIPVLHKVDPNNKKTQVILVVVVSPIRGNLCSLVRCSNCCVLGALFRFPSFVLICRNFPYSALTRHFLGAT